MDVIVITGVWWVDLGLLLVALDLTGIVDINGWGGKRYSILHGEWLP